MTAREAQGLPATIQDPDVYRRIARLIVARISKAGGAS